MKKDHKNYKRAKELLRREKWASADSKWVVLDYAEMADGLEILIYAQASLFEERKVAEYNITTRIAVFTAGRETAMSSLIINQLWRKANLPRGHKRS